MHLCELHPGPPEGLKTAGHAQDREKGGCRTRDQPVWGSFPEKYSSLESPKCHFVHFKQNFDL
jgi:hypothetical protein